MKRVAKALEVGVKSAMEGPDPCEYRMAGLKVKCNHCGSTLFHARDAQLNTAGMTFFRLDWANKSARALTCAKCSMIQWFLSAPEEVQRSRK